MFPNPESYPTDAIALQQEWLCGLTGDMPSEWRIHILYLPQGWKYKVSCNKLAMITLDYMQHTSMCSYYLKLQNIRITATV